MLRSIARPLSRAALRTTATIAPVAVARPAVVAATRVAPVAVRSVAQPVRAMSSQWDEVPEYTSNVFVSAPAPGITAPAVIDGKITEWSTKNVNGKWLVLFFYPLNFTFVCPTEIIAFSDRVKEFAALNTEVVACSVDSTNSTLAWINQSRDKGGLGKMNIPVISDLTHEISARYGVLLPKGIALRGLFLIDPKGILRQMTVNDLPVGRSVDETLRLIQAFQYVEKHGEVCPANWTPGKDTMKADPEGAKAYWKKTHSK